VLGGFAATVFVSVSVEAAAEAERAESVGGGGRGVVCAGGGVSGRDIGCSGDIDDIGRGMGWR
jgi:hypothetical protein